MKMEIVSDPSGNNRRLVFDCGYGIRLLTVDAIQDLRDEDYRAYRKKFTDLKYRGEGSADAHKALDYLRYTIKNETRRRGF